MKFLWKIKLKKNELKKYDESKKNGPTPRIFQKDKIIIPFFNEKEKIGEKIFLNAFLSNKISEYLFPQFKYVTKVGGKLKYIHPIYLDEENLPCYIRFIENKRKAKIRNKERK